MQRTSTQRGFSLVEMSIVLLIIALVTGGFAYSRMLLRSAQVQSITTDINQYKSAINAFVIKYDGLPGDMVNNSTYWPHAMDGITAVVWAGDGSESIGDINGDGNGRIDNYEPLYAWLILDISGVAPGLSTKLRGHSVGSDGSSILGYLNEVFGIPSANACYPVAPGSNIPPTQIDGGGYQLSHSHTTLYGRNDNAIIVGKLEGPAPSGMRGPLLTPAEAIQLDAKMDDGIANTGTVVADSGVASATPCLSGSNQYLKDDTNVSCYLQFWLAKP